MYYKLSIGRALGIELARAYATAVRSLGAVALPGLPEMYRLTDTASAITALAMPMRNVSIVCIESNCQIVEMSDWIMHHMRDPRYGRLRSRARGMPRVLMPRGKGVIPIYDCDLASCGRG